MIVNNPKLSVFKPLSENRVLGVQSGSLTADRRERKSLSVEGSEVKAQTSRSAHIHVLLLWIIATRRRRAQSEWEFTYASQDVEKCVSECVMSSCPWRGWGGISELCGLSSLRTPYLVEWTSSVPWLPAVLMPRRGRTVVHKQQGGVILRWKMWPHTWTSVMWRRGGQLPVH